MPLKLTVLPLVLIIVASIVALLWFAFSGGNTSRAGASPDPQAQPPIVTVASAGSFFLLRVRDDEKQAWCYVLQHQSEGAKALDCMGDADAAATQALKGWVYYP